MERDCGLTIRRIVQNGHLLASVDRETAMKKFLKSIFVISVCDFGIFVFMLTGIVFGMIFKLERFMFYLISICSILCIILYIALILISVVKIIKAVISVKTKKLTTIFKILAVDIVMALPSYLIIAAAMTLARQ